MNNEKFFSHFLSSWQDYTVHYLERAKKVFSLFCYPFSPFAKQREKLFLLFSSDFFSQNFDLKGIFRLDTLLVDEMTLYIAMKMDRKMTLQILNDLTKVKVRWWKTWKVLQTASCHHCSSFDWKIKLVFVSSSSFHFFVRLLEDSFEWKLFVKDWKLSIVLERKFKKNKTSIVKKLRSSILNWKTRDEFKVLLLPIGIEFWLIST